MVLEVNTSNLMAKYNPNNILNPTEVTTGTDSFDCIIDKRMMQAQQEISNLVKNVAIATLNGYRMREPNSLDEYTDFRSAQLIVQNTSAEDPTKNIDFESEYQAYIKSRGCENEKELNILNSHYGMFKTKDELLDFAASSISENITGLRLNGFCKKDISGANCKSALSNMDLQNVSDYLKADNTLPNFKERVCAMQSFAKLISKQASVDPDIRKFFVEFGQDISDSSDAISKFSDEMEKENEAYRLRNSNNPKYNESLIANYKN